MMLASLFAAGAVGCIVGAIPGAVFGYWLRGYRDADQHDPYDDGSTP